MFNTQFLKSCIFFIFLWNSIILTEIPILKLSWLLVDGTLVQHSKYSEKKKIWSLVLPCQIKDKDI